MTAQAFPLTRTFRQIASTVFQRMGATAAGETPQPHELAAALDRANTMLDGWATQRLTIYTTAINTDLTTVAGTARYTIGPVGADVLTARPVFHPMVGLMVGTIEWSIDVLDINQYSLIGDKVLRGQPRLAYFDRAFPTAGLTFWPVPDAAYPVTLYLPEALTAFADLNTEYRFPAGYLRAIEWNLANELPDYCQPSMRDLVEKNALLAMRDIKSANLTVDILTSDYAALPRRWDILNDRPWQ